MRFALRLYPRVWRERYGDEFEALLEQTGLSLRDFANVFKGALDMQLRSIEFWRFAAAGASLGALALGVWAATQPVRYVSKAILAIGISNLDEATKTLNQAATAALSRNELAAIISRRQLYPGANRATADVVGEMRRNIQIGLIGGPLKLRGDLPIQSAFSIWFRYPDPHAASAVNSDLISIYSRALASQTGPDGKPLTPLVLDEPSLPERPSIKAVSAMLVIGSVLGGALAGLAYGLFKLASRLFRRVAAQ
jgi:hypothetical protein